MGLVNYNTEAPASGWRRYRMHLTLWLVQDPARSCGTGYLRFSAVVKCSGIPVSLG